jgi:hypothetical protein
MAAEKGGTAPSSEELHDLRTPSHVAAMIIDRGDREKACTEVGN